MRDNFAASVMETLAKRVSFRCSNQQCRRTTVGPKEECTGTASVGVASHITAASPGGPRYKESLSGKQRKSFENAIWLCHNCARLIDTNPDVYTETHLLNWKTQAEQITLEELKGWEVRKNRHLVFKLLETNLSRLIAEMRDDITNHPLQRELILFDRDWIYLSGNNSVFVYYFGDHDHLRQQIRILENRGAIKDIKFNSVERFVMLEDFVDYLRFTELSQSEQQCS